jgi:TonB family protein
MLLLYIMRKFETLALFLVLLSVEVQAQDTPMNAPEVMPVLNSCALIEDRTERETCSNQGIMEHIINKLQYPEAAQQAGIEGTVIVKFIIDKRGQVSEAKVLKGPEALSKAAETVVRGLPGFTPGTQNGKPVNVELVLPIRFALSDD